MRRFMSTIALIAFCSLNHAGGHDEAERKLRCSQLAGHVLQTLALEQKQFPRITFNAIEEELRVEGDPAMTGALAKLIALVESKQPGDVELSPVLVVYSFGEDSDARTRSREKAFRVFLQEAGLSSVSTATNGTEAGRNICVIAGTPGEIRIMRALVAACHAYAAASQDH